SVVAKPLATRARIGQYVLPREDERRAGPTAERIRQWRVGFRNPFVMPRLGGGTRGGHRRGDRAGGCCRGGCDRAWWWESSSRAGVARGRGGDGVGYSGSHRRVVRVRVGGARRSACGRGILGAGFGSNARRPRWRWGPVPAFG